MFRQRKKTVDSDEESRLADDNEKKPRGSAKYRRVAIAILALTSIYVFGHVFGTEINFDSVSMLPSQLEKYPPISTGVYQPSLRLDVGEPTRKCTVEEARKQAEFVPVARIRGCPSEDDAWLRFAQSLLPHAKVFLDIGSNKGYTAARFFELWTPELGLDSKGLHTALKRVTTEKDLTECGACNDCMETGVSLLPIFQRYCSRAAEYTSDPNMARSLSKAVSKLCEEKAANYKPIRVFSFDGNPVMVNGVTNARNWLADNDVGVSSLKGVDGVPESRLPKTPKKNFLKNYWTIELGAFSDKYEEGKTVEFVLGIGEKGHLLTDGNEQNKKLETSEKRAIVPVLSIDHIFEREGIAHADIVKVDTEGHDPNVLLGASKILKEGRVTLVIFEYNAIWSLNDKLQDVVLELLEPSQYVCYLEGKNMLLKLNYGCWSDALEMRKWSNVWCISLRHVEGIALSSVFDSYSMAFV